MSSTVESHKMDEDTNVSKNIKLPPRDHILLRPEMYISSVTTATSTVVTYNITSRLELVSNAPINNGVVHLLKEIVSNAVDNSAKNGAIDALKTKLGTKKDAQKICRDSDALVDVELTPKYMSVTNYGAPFNIDVRADDPSRFIPESCFNELNYGSNYDDDGKPRIGTGRNGVGATLPYFLSKDFELECVDFKRKRFFYMHVTNNGDPSTLVKKVWPPLVNGKAVNGTDKTPPERVAKAFAKGRSFTCVKWTPDTEEGDLDLDAILAYEKTLEVDDIVIIRRKGMNGDSEDIRTIVTGTNPVVLGTAKVPLIGVKSMTHIRCVRTKTSLPPTACIFHGSCGISDVEIDLAARSILDFTLTGVPFILRRKWSTGKELEELLTPIDVETYGKLMFSGKSMTTTWTSHDNQIKAHVAYFDSPCEAVQMGFVNGLWADTGLHMNAAWSALLTKLKDTPEIKKNAPKLTVTDFKKHISTVILCMGLNPKQEGQTKTSLSMISGKKSFSINSITDADIHSISSGRGSWDAYKALVETGKSQEMLMLKRQLTKCHISGFSAANIEGLASVLVLTEGLSCKSYADIVRNQQDQEKRDRMGIFPMRGVPRNLYGATPADALSNKMFASLMHVTGLDLSKTYEDDSDLKTLKYGSFIFMGDPDLDGFHIIALMLANFYNYWPNLFKQRRIGILRTPVIRVYRSENSTEVLARYFSDKEYELDANAPKGYIKRIKGLGSVNVGTLERAGDELLDDMEHSSVVWFEMDERGTKALHAFFSSGNSDVRKKCITAMAKTCQDITGLHVEDTRCNLISFGPAPIMKRSVESYVRKEIVNFSVGNLIRQIPSAKDGLKDSQRKIMAWFLENTNYGKKSGRHKVEQMTGEAGRSQHYHHGQIILGATAKRMAVQDFAGGNNIPLFKNDSNVGSKTNWPKDAAADRYVFLSAPSYLQYLIAKQTYNAVERIMSEGVAIEPVYLPFVIPIGIVNGFSGVGSGWSTYLPPHELLSICKQMRELALADIEKREPIRLDIPVWYAHFRGSISILRNVKAVDIPEEHIDDAEKLEAELKETDNVVIEPDELPQETTLEVDEGDFTERAVRASGIWRFEDPPSNAKESVKKMMFITEIPPEMRYQQLDDIIAKLKALGHIVTFYHDTKYGMDYRLGLSESGIELARSGKLQKCLRLTATYSLMNFNMLDEYGAPMKFEDVHAYLKFFYGNLIGTYQKSIDNQITDIEAHIAVLTTKRNFASGCMNGHIDLGKLNREQLKTKLVELSIDYAIARTVSSCDCNAEYVSDIDENIAGERERIRVLKNTHPAKFYLEHLVEFVKHMPKLVQPKKVSETEWTSQEPPIKRSR